VSKIFLRKAKGSDCEDIFRWRNDPITRIASFNSKTISYKVHKKWFNESLENSHRHIFIAQDSRGNKIGTVRVDEVNDNVAEININLAPRKRGKGYGSKVIELACRNNCLAGAVCLFIARVKKDNLPSVRAFKKAGFFELFNYRDVKACQIVVLGRRRIRNE